jgi:serine protease Do
VRYAYAITAALLLGGTAATMALQSPSNAQVAQNEPGALGMASAPKPGAPLSFADLAAKLQPAVVNISTKNQVEVQQNPFAGTPFGDLFGGGQQGGGGNNGRPVTREATSLGSGFIISEDGYIVTNSHVISGGRPGNPAVGSITVIMPDRKEYSAKLVGRDPSSDLAVLKIEARGLPFVRFGDSQATRVGDWVVAIGNPYGLGGSVTAGIVSALHRNIGSGPYDRYIQTDAAINQGNSGGPMFDLNGNVIGINSAIFSPTGGNVGIGFAIPAELAKPIVDTLRGGAKVKRGYLGVGIRQLDSESAEALGLAKNRGELVERVEPGQGAAKAGIQAGDVIVKVNGREVTPDETLSYTVARLPIGSRVPIELYRAGKRMTVTAMLAERPTEEQLASIIGGENGGGLGNEDAQTKGNAAREVLGLAVQGLTPDLARSLNVAPGTRGVVIGAVDPSSDAAGKGVQRGDVITSVNQAPVASAADLAGAVSAAQTAGRGSVLVQIQRGTGRSVYMPLRLKAK